MAATLTWLDLSAHGLALGLGAVKETPEFVVVGRREGFEKHAEALKSLGFLPRGAHYYLPSGAPVPSFNQWKAHFSAASMNPETKPGRVAKDKISAIFMVENGWVDREAMFPTAVGPENREPEPVAEGEPAAEEPATEEPATEEPATEVSGAGDPDAQDPVAEMPTSNQSDPEQSTSESGAAAPAQSSDQQNSGQSSEQVRWLSLERYGLSVQYRAIDGNHRLTDEEQGRSLVILGGRQTESLYIDTFKALGAEVDMDKRHGEHARIVFDNSQKTGALLKEILKAFPNGEATLMSREYVLGKAGNSNDILDYDVVEEIDWLGFGEHLQDKIKDRLESSDVKGFSDQELRDTLQAFSGLQEELVSRDAGVSGRRLQEALESATVAFFMQSLQGSAEMSVAYAASIDQLLPKDNVKSGKSQNLQQFSTPLSLSFVAQDILGINGDTTVWEPTAGNGSLVAMASAANVSGYELDRDRVAQLHGLGFTGIKHGDAHRSEIPDRSHDRVVMNPPFGAFADGKGPREFTSFVPMNDAKTLFPKMKLGQQDQYIALRHLQALKDDGLGFIILGADHPMKFEAGQYSDTTRNFLQMLNDTHEVVAMRYVSGSLYSTHGAGWPLLAIVTAGRREQAQEVTLPKDLQVIKSLDDLEEFRLAMKEELVKWNRQLESDSRNKSDQERNANGGSGPAGDGQGSGDSPSEEDSTSETPEEEEEPVEKEFDESHVSDDAFDAFEDDEDNPDDIEARHAAEDAEVPYAPRSRMKSLNKMVPANMAAPIMRALDKVEMHHGNIDSYVAEELGWTLEELEQRLAAEQVDAVGLAMHQGSLDRGFILGDNTGIGKGRVMATMVAWGIKQGKKPIFMTSKAGLFADIMRDFRDIGEDHLLKPLVMNDIPTIKDSEGVTVLKNTPQADLAPLLAKNTIGDNHNCVFMTYSQINREMGKCKKAQWLSFVAEDNFLLLDEVHNGAGNESNTGANLIEAIRAADFTLGSSGTYAKRPDNLGLYIFTSMFDGTDADTLMETVSTGGTEYQELLSTMLAESGQMIVRSHPQAPSPVPNIVEVSYGGLDGREITDRLAVILDALTGISEGTSEIVNETNKGIKELLDKLDDSERSKSKRWGSKTLNFGSIMHNVVRQAVFAMKSQGVVDAVKKSLNEGKRVVVGIDNTMETFLHHALESIRSEMAAASSELVDSAVEQGRDKYIAAELDKSVPANISYRDTLYRLMERLITIEHTDRYGNITKEAAFNVAAKREDYEDGSLMERIASGMTLKGDVMAQAYFDAEELVGTLPEDLPASPIDFIRNSLAEAGIESTEITGRSLQIDYSDPENPVFKNRSNEDRDRLRAAGEFNNGNSQVVFVNSSGAEGVSLHGHKDFKNNEDRMMLFAQVPYDIAVYNQLAGRIDRSGAREGYRPGYELLGLDIPAEKRQMANLVRKDMSLKANTRADREGKVETLGVPMMNRVGDQVTFEQLRDHPDRDRIEKKLGIDLEREEGQFSSVSMKAGVGNETGLYSKVMSRLSRMKLSEAEPIVELFEESYKQRIEQLDRAGINPLKTQILDLRARFTEDVYEIVPKSGPSAFQSSVDAKVIRFDQSVEPIPLSVVQSQKEVSLRKLENIGLGEYPMVGKWDEIADKQNKEILRHARKRDPDLYERLLKKHGNDENATAADIRETVLKRPGETKMNDEALEIVRSVARRHNLFASLRDSLGIGVRISGISLSDMGVEDDDDTADFVITAIKPPRPLDNPAAASNWGITLMSPEGKAGMARISLSQLNQIISETPTIRFDQEPLTDNALEALFHKDREGFVVERQRIVLMGNLFGAAEAAKNASKEHDGVGQANPVVFTDEHGVKHRGMLMSSWFEVNDISKLKTVDFTVSKTDIAEAYIDHLVQTAEGKEPTLYSTNAWYTVQGRRANNKVDQLGSGAVLYRDLTTSRWKIRISHMKKDNQDYIKDGVLSNFLEGEFERCKDHLSRNIMEASLKNNADLPDVLARLMSHHRLNFHGHAEDAEWYRAHLRNRAQELEIKERELEKAMALEKADQQEVQEAPNLPELPSNEDEVVGDRTTRTPVLAGGAFPGF